jgi:putative thiamine transport system substrate-binding protein
MRLSLIALIAAFGIPAHADTWDETLAAARGQTVYWNAWGGDDRTNAFIAWVGEQTEAQFGVSVEQVKLTDTAEAVARVLAETAAGTEDGSVDLIWINGPNFLAMKEQGLLHGPFVGGLPNARYLDLSPGSPASVDFTVPVDGLESPWRLAKFVFTYDSARLPEPPRSMTGLADWAADNPGRFTHPDASNFMGSTFLKQALIELAPDPDVLQDPVSDAAYASATAPLWAWYDALRPNLWRSGESFPENASVLEQMLSDGEVDIAMSFDPGSAAASIAAGLLPDTVRVFTPEAGSIGNLSFVAIPVNAANKEGAMVVANFLLDPATQARAQDTSVLGAYSALDPAKLDAGAMAAFAALSADPALPSIDELGPTLLEPHPSWMTRVAEDWARRVTE